LVYSGAVHRQSGKLAEIVVFGPPNLSGGCPQILDQIYKITPISNLVSYKGCLLVERPERFGSKRNKKKKETSVEK